MARELVVAQTVCIVLMMALCEIIIGKNVAVIISLCLGTALTIFTVSWVDRDEIVKLALLRTGRTALLISALVIFAVHPAGNDAFRKIFIVLLLIATSVSVKSTIQKVFRSSEGISQLN